MQGNDDEAWQRALAAHGLSLIRTDAMSRGIAAARQFEPGAILLRCAPAASVLSMPSTPTHCHSCFAASEKLKRCSGCGHARYCCTEHQRAAWPMHRSQCRVLKHTRPSVPGTSILLCARLLDLARDDPAASPSAGLTEGDASTSGIRAVFSLSSQLNSSNAERRAEYAHQAAMLCALLAEALPDRTAPSVSPSGSHLASHIASSTLIALTHPSFPCRPHVSRSIWPLSS